uniref:Uncharacterized protein n=1 Tax=Cryptomonas curvata TaxID=233186 RepID=A0A7S0N579_9CRYP
MVAPEDLGVPKPPQPKDPWCERCVGVTLFTRNMRSRGMPPACAGFRKRLPEEVGLASFSEEDLMEGEMDFDCCLGASYETAKMRSQGAAPACSTGLHIARYRWANSDSQVVTAPDGAAVADQGPRGAGGAQAGPRDGRMPGPGPVPGGLPGFPVGSDSLRGSLLAAYRESFVVVRKAAAKATDRGYNERLLAHATRAHAKLCDQATRQAERVAAWLRSAVDSARSK